MRNYTTNINLCFLLYIIIKKTGKEVDVVKVEVLP